MSFAHHESINGVRTSFESPQFEGLVKAVSNARKKARLRKSDYNIVYNEMRKRYPNGDSTGRKASRKMFYQDAIAGAKAYLSGAKALGKNVLGQTVDATELKRREAICMKCPMRNGMAGCKAGCGMSQSAVNALDEASKKLFGKARNDISPALRTLFCDVCGCALSVMLPAHIDDFPVDTESKASIRPKNCWLTTENRKLSA